MDSHTHFASAQEARHLSSSPETDVPAPVPMQASLLACDPANGVHASGCACAARHVRLIRGN